MATDSPPPSDSSLLEGENRKTTFGNRTPRFWYWTFGICLLVIMLIVGLVCGLVFGLRHTHARNTNDESSGSNSSSETLSLNVDLGYSSYQGSNYPGGISTWLGIRYAAAPVGDLRFSAPQDPVTDNKEYTVNQRGPVCHLSPSTAIDTAKSEDCLFLNVFAPTETKGSHPVFVYFQGGGFNSLSAPNLNGTSLITAADHDMVVVTFNYRVGVYGFLASKEVQSGGALNAGLLDQRKLLHWVQKYIHLFGGDPTRVTIGGASAGGASVDLHMSAYGGRDDGLFHGAAAESQSFSAQFTVEESQYQYDALIKRVGCSTTDSLKCLRALDTATISDNNVFISTPGGSGGIPVFMYSPVIDGKFSQDYTYNSFAQGKFVKVPSIFGDVTNEGTIFTPTNINTSTQFHNFLKDNFFNLTTADLGQIDTFYPQAEQFSGKGTYWRTAANAYGDMRYICPGINISSMISTHSESQNWNYHWDVLESGNAASGLGVTHTAESGSIWGSSEQLPESALNPIIQAYWTSFIRSGDPNKYKLSSAPTWGTFNTSSMQRIHFTNDPSNVAMEAIPADQKARCQYLSNIGPLLQQ